MRTAVGIEELESRLNLLIGKPVWAVRDGAGTGSTVSIHLGDKIPRQKTYGIPSLSEGEMRYQSEFGPMTSCAWRVELEEAGIVSGSGDLEDETMMSGPMKLIGETVAEVSINSFLDLLVVFSGGIRLRLLCDQRTDDLDTDFCYTLFIRQEEACSVGNGVITLDRSSEGEPLG